MQKRNLAQVAVTVVVVDSCGFDDAFDDDCKSKKRKNFEVNAKESEIIIIGSQQRSTGRVFDFIVIKIKAWRLAKSVRKKAGISNLANQRESH